VPTRAGSDTLVYQSNFLTIYDYHRDLDSKITLETDAMISDVDLKTRGFMLYPEEDNEEKPLLRT
jgi:hypothetical protein